MTKHTIGTQALRRALAAARLPLHVRVRVGTYQILDLVPRGRDEDGLEQRNWWWRRHDEHGLGRGHVRECVATDVVILERIPFRTRGDEFAGDSASI